MHMMLEPITHAIYRLECQLKTEGVCRIPIPLTHVMIHPRVSLSSTIVKCAERLCVLDSEVDK